MAVVCIFLKSKIMLSIFSALAASFFGKVSIPVLAHLVLPLPLGYRAMVFYHTLDSRLYWTYYSIQIFSPILWALFTTLIIYFDTQKFLCYLCICTCVFKHVYVCITAYRCRGHNTSDITSQAPSTLFCLWQDHSLAWNLTHDDDGWPVSLRVSCLHHHSTGIITVQHHPRVLLWVLILELRSSCFHQPAGLLSSAIVMSPNP